MRISDWSSDVCSSDLLAGEHVIIAVGDQQTERRLGDRDPDAEERQCRLQRDGMRHLHRRDHDKRRQAVGQQVAEHDASVREGEAGGGIDVLLAALDQGTAAYRSEEHTSELQSLMSITSAVLRLKHKTTTTNTHLLEAQD